MKERQRYAIHIEVLAANKADVRDLFRCEAHVSYSLRLEKPMNSSYGLCLVFGTGDIDKGTGTFSNPRHTSWFLFLEC